MGSGSSVATKPKASTETKSRDIYDFEAIRNINKETELLREACKDVTVLDSFIDDTQAYSRTTRRSASSDRVLVTDSVHITVNKLNDYFDDIDKSLDKLKAYLDQFKDAVFERCKQYSDDEQLSKLSRVRQQINILDDVILRAREQLVSARKGNASSRRIKGIKQQVQDLELFKSELESNGALSTRSARSELSETDFVVGDIIKWREEALTMKRKYETEHENNTKLRSEREKELLDLQDTNIKLIKEIKELRHEVNKADETVEQCEANVQAIKETLLDERLSHEVEINSLKAMIEKQDEIIARLMLKSTSTTPAPGKGDVRLSPEGFGGLEEESLFKKDDEEVDENISSLNNDLHKENELEKDALGENSPEPLECEIETPDDPLNETTDKSKKPKNEVATSDSECKDYTNLLVSEENDNAISKDASEDAQPKLDKKDESTVNLEEESISNVASLAKAEEDFTVDKEVNKEQIQNEVLMYEEGITKEIVYRRNDGDIDGNLSYHKGVGAVLQTTNKDFGVDSITCDIIDELEINMLPDFVEGERVVSFQIHFQKKYGVDVELQEGESFSLFVPHRHIHDFEEASLIQSVDGGDWEPCDQLDERPTALNDDVLIVGTKLTSLNDVKLIAIAREKVENIVVEGNNSEIVHQSQNDKSVTLKLKANTFDKHSEVKLLVHDSHRREMPTAVEIHDECKQIVSCTAFVSITSEVMTKQDVDIIMELQEDLEAECKYTMFSLEDTGWKLADCDWNKDNQLLVVHLRSGFKKYRILGLELPKDTSVEDRLLGVNTLHQHIGHHLVRLLFRQREDDPSQAVVICLSSRLVKAGIYELKELGYSVGGYPSSQFCMLEGDTLRIECTGDIMATPVNSEKMEISFYPQRGIATKQLSLRYHDDVDINSQNKEGCLQVMRADDTDRIILGETIYMDLKDRTDT